MSSVAESTSPMVETRGSRKIHRAEYTCQLIEEELEAKDWFVEVENVPKKAKFSKKFFKTASLKLGIPEMCHHKSRNPEMGQLNWGIPEMCYHKLRIPEIYKLKSGSTF